MRLCPGRLGCAAWVSPIFVPAFPVNSAFDSFFSRPDHRFGKQFVDRLYRRYSREINLQITQNPTLSKLLLVWAHWTHHGYGFCNMEEPDIWRLRERRLARSALSLQRQRCTDFRDKGRVLLFLPNVSVNLRITWKEAVMYIIASILIRSTTQAVCHFAKGLPFYGDEAVESSIM